MNTSINPASDVNYAPTMDAPVPTRALGLVALAALASVLVLGRVEPPSGMPPARTSPSPPVPAAPVPAAFEPWPPLVVTWEVTGWPDWNRRHDPLRVPDAGPCAALDAPGTCHVRIAWAGEGRWAMTLSRDALFDDGDALVIADGEHRSPPPPTTICGELLAPSRSGEGVTAAWRTERGPPQSGLLTVAFTGRRGELARCLSPWGVPLVFTDEGFSWRWSALSFRYPTMHELGEPGAA